METPPPDELHGRVFGGRYRIDRVLKRGGMGAVYVATDTTTLVEVAVKVVRSTLADDPQAVARFKRETRLMTEVVHDNIVRAIDAGDDDGVLWIAMELLNGVSLRERLDTRGRWTWPDALAVVRQLATALGAAHALGVIHRDLKPENIMLIDTNGGVMVKLVDFGVAKQARSDSDAGDTSHMTGTGLIIGTPGYVAPEVVLEGITDDPRSDFYALGVTWFELLTGQKPFTAKTPFALALRHAHEVPPTPSSLLPFAPVPPVVEALVMRLLAKSPASRPTDALTLLDELDQLIAASQQASTPLPAAGRSTGPSLSTETALGNAGRTGVIPLSGTPRPAPPPSSTPSASPASSSSPSPSPSSSSPSSSLSSSLVGSATPATLMSAPKPAVDRRTARVAAIAALALVLGVAVGVGIVARRRPPPQAPTVAGVADVVVADVVVADVVVADVVVSPPLPIAPPSLPSLELPISAELPPAPAVVPPPSPPLEAIVRGIRDRRATRVARRDGDAAAADTASSKASGTVVVSPRPKSASWRVSVDGQSALETPRRFELSVGTHTLRFTSPMTQTPIERTVIVVAGEVVHFSEELRR